MKKTLKLTAIIMLMASAAACNTISGIGQDLESVGGAIEKTADENNNTKK